MFYHGLLIRKWPSICHHPFHVSGSLDRQAPAIEEPAYTIEKAWEAEQIEIRINAPRVMAVTQRDHAGG